MWTEGQTEEHSEADAAYSAPDFSLEDSCERLEMLLIFKKASKSLITPVRA